MLYWSAGTFAFLSALGMCVLLSSVAGMCSGVLSLQQGWDPSEEVEGGMWRGRGEEGSFQCLQEQTAAVVELAGRLKSCCWYRYPVAERGASLVAQRRPGEPAVCCSPPPGPACGRRSVASLSSGRWFSRVREAAARCKRKFCGVGGEVKGEVGATPRSQGCVWKNLFADYMRY